MVLLDSNIFIFAMQPKYHGLRQWCLSQQIHASDITRIDRAIALRRSKKMTLGDAIIAATALEYNLTLATHNTKDFLWIDSLTVVDPIAETKHA